MCTHPHWPEALVGFVVDLEIPFVAVLLQLHEAPKLNDPTMRSRGEAGSPRTDSWGL